MSALRADQLAIAGWIAPGSRVLDLGCGDGSLLVHLRQQRGVTGYGIEIAQENIVRCLDAGVNVIQSDLDRGLSDFADGSFDYVVMSETLQAIRFPHRILHEMLRVGREGIVTFPNFGFWKCRVQIGTGRMPVTEHLPHSWYDTPNIHMCTIRDFEALCLRDGISIVERRTVDADHRETFGARWLPNLFAEIALYRCRRGKA